MIKFLAALFWVIPLFAEAQNKIEIHSDIFTKNRNLSISLNGEETSSTPGTFTISKGIDYEITLRDQSGSVKSRFNFVVKEFGNKNNAEPPAWFSNSDKLGNTHADYRLFTAKGRSPSMAIAMNKGFDGAKLNAGFDVDSKSPDFRLLRAEIQIIGDYYEAYLLTGHKK